MSIFIVQCKKRQLARCSLILFREFYTKFCVKSFDSSGLLKIILPKLFVRRITFKLNFIYRKHSPLFLLSTDHCLLTTYYKKTNFPRL